MELLTKNDIGMLLEKGTGHCVSIYMPAHRYGDVQQDPLRFKNLLRKAEEMLIKEGLPMKEATEVLNPALHLLLNDFFKEHQADGFVMFVARGVFLFYWTPVKFEEQVVVGPRFHLKPLWPLLLSEESTFYLLTLNRKDVRLYRGTPFSLEKLAVPRMPTSMATLLRHMVFDTLNERQPTAQGVGRTRQPVYNSDDNETDIRRAENFNFFRMVNDALHPFLNGVKAPLVLAGVDHLLPLYCDANTYPYLVRDEVIKGDPDDMPEAELQRKALSIAEPHFNRSREEMFWRYLHFKGVDSDIATDDVKRIVAMAMSGRVDTLFLVEGAQVWGAVDENAWTVSELYAENRPGAEELADLAALHTMRHDGKVYLIPQDRVPCGVNLAAILRY